MSRLITLLFALCPAGVLPMEATSEVGTTAIPIEVPEAPPAAPPSLEFTSPSGMKVGYSFDHYANNRNMQHTFISAEMLKAANATNQWKSSAWDISKVASRLTGLLSLHTHSVSTAKMVRKDWKMVDKMRIYEKYIQTNWNGNVELIAYCRKGRGHTIEELIIFKFRDSYCARVIQLTGKLRPEDINHIIRQS